MADLHEFETYIVVLKLPVFTLIAFKCILPFSYERMSLVNVLATAKRIG